MLFSYIKGGLAIGIGFCAMIAGVKLGVKTARKELLSEIEDSVRAATSRGIRKGCEEAKLIGATKTEG